MRPEGVPGSAKMRHHVRATQVGWGRYVGWLAGVTLAIVIPFTAAVKDARLEDARRAPHGGYKQKERRHGAASARTFSEL